MNKFAYVVAAVVSFAVAAPTIASAQTVVIKNGHHGMGARAEYSRGEFGSHTPCVAAPPANVQLMAKNFLTI